MIFAVPSSKKESAVGLPPDSAFFISGARPRIKRPPAEIITLITIS